MNLPNRSAFFLVPVALLAFFAPSVLGCFVIFAAAILYTSFLDRFCKYLTLQVAKSLSSSAKMKFIKGPSSLFLIGALLSVVFIVVGFTWGNSSANFTLPAVHHFLSLVSLVSHLLCLAMLAGMIKLLPLAPDFRNEAASTAGKGRIGK